MPKKKGGKSISSGAQYVIVHSKLDEEKSKNAGLALEIGNWLSIIAQFAVASTRRSNPVHSHQ